MHFNGELAWTRCFGWSKCAWRSELNLIMKNIRIVHSEYSEFICSRYVQWRLEFVSQKINRSVGEITESNKRKLIKAQDDIIYSAPSWQQSPEMYVISFYILGIHSNIIFLAKFSFFSFIQIVNVYRCMHVCNLYFLIYVI